MSMPDQNAAEAHYDRLDAQGQFSAAEQREISGLETDGYSDDFSASAIRARLGLAEPAPFEGEAESDSEELARYRKLGYICCGDCAVEVAPGKTCIGGHLTNPEKGKPRVNG